MTYASLLDKKPYDLIDWLDKMHNEPLPEDLQDASDMARAGSMLATLSNCYCTLMTLSSQAKVAVRELSRQVRKNDASTKWAYEDMVDRSHAIECAIKAVSNRMTTISRQITTKQEVNKELFMTNGK